MQTPRPTLQSAPTDRYAVRIIGQFGGHRRLPHSSLRPDDRHPRTRPEPATARTLARVQQNALPGVEHDEPDRAIAQTRLDTARSGLLIARLICNARESPQCAVRPRSRTSPTRRSGIPRCHGRPAHSGMVWVIRSELTTRTCGAWEPQRVAHPSKGPNHAQRMRCEH
jgi:hypothetical protein